MQFKYLIPLVLSVLPTASFSQVMTIENQKQAIDFYDIPDGLYLLKLTGKNGNEYTEKIVVKK